VVYAREVGERRLTFQVSGKLWRNAMVMQDRQTGSLWCHVTGEALDGPLAAARLRQLPAVQTTWKLWRREHPATEVLSKPEDIRASRYEAYFADPERTGLFRTEWLQDRLPGKAKIVGIVDGTYALAVTDELLIVGQPLVAVLGEEPIVLLRAPDGGVRGFRASLDATALTFAATDKPHRFLDGQTGSFWDLVSGIAVQGPMEGNQLSELMIHTAYWFAWSSFFPHTAVLD
jgi:hypothetical protein